MLTLYFQLKASQEADKADLMAIRDKLKPPKPETLSSSSDHRQVLYQRIRGLRT